MTVLSANRLSGTKIVRDQIVRDQMRKAGSHLRRKFQPRSPYHEAKNVQNSLSSTRGTKNDDSQRNESFWFAGQRKWDESREWYSKPHLHVVYIVGVQKQSAIVRNSTLVRRTETIQNEGSRALIIEQTSRGPYSAVSKPVQKTRKKIRDRRDLGSFLSLTRTFIVDIDR